MTGSDSPTPLRLRALRLVALLLLSTGAAVAAGAVDPLVQRVIEQIEAGQFAVAGRDITDVLARDGIDEATRRELLFQRERMRRIRMDFALDAEAVKARLRHEIPDLHDAEFADWERRGLIEYRVIDGEVRYFNRAPSNLFRLSAEARARRADPKPFRDGPMEAPNAHHRAIVAAAREQGRSSVLPRRVRVTQSLTVKADAVPDGETIRAWIPYPRAIAGQQEDIRFVRSEPRTHRIASESAMQRTVHLERAARKGRPTRFSITYEVTLFGRHVAIDPARADGAPPPAELVEFIAERPPHIVFDANMRLFSRQIVGNETDLLRIARKLYAAVDRIPWAGAREYSTIPNIAAHALHVGHADCGQQTLLLMTLLRMNGIPARWQSGMVFSDGDYWNLHDWGQVWIAPWGWLPMDVTTGHMDDPDPSVAGFYLGGLDAYRIAFNDDFGRDFEPPKRHFRSDTVDSQRGEAEWDGGNLYYDQWDYDFEWTILPPAKGRQAKTR